MCIGRMIKFLPMIAKLPGNVNSVEVIASRVDNAEEGTGYDDIDTNKLTNCIANASTGMTSAKARILQQTLSTHYSQ